MSGKIGLVTFFRDNYGSELQCYATKTFLEKMDMNAMLYTSIVTDLAKSRNVLNQFQRSLCIQFYIEVLLKTEKHK